MSDFKISRIRYTWRNAWTNGVAYNRDDVIRYAGSTWICQRQHTATTFAADQAFSVGTVASPAWFTMTEGREWRSQWNASTLYNPGDLALYGGVIYLCVISHTSSTVFASNAEKWTLYLAANAWRTDWLPNIRYGIGDVIKYSGAVYRCVQEHTSSTVDLGLENDQPKWQIYYDGFEFIGNYTSGARYQTNDLVKYSSSIFQCTISHVGSAVLNTAFFDTLLQGNKFYSQWSNSSHYVIGDIVRHGGYLYVANAVSFQNNPAADNTTQWNVLSKGIDFLGQWSATNSYKPGDVVRRGGNLYVSIANSANDGSSLDYLDSGSWELLTVGQNFQGIWNETTTYAVNDVVVYRGSTYACNQQHLSSDQNSPGDNGSGFFYWDILLAPAANAALQQQGDLLTFDLSETAKGDLSTFSTARVPVGSIDQVVSINNTDSIVYRTYNLAERVVYVDTHGIDEIGIADNGFSQQRPWRTIRFACQQLDDLYSGHTTINVGVGLFREITPISVPAKTVILGSELRATTVSASESVLSTADRPYHVSVLARLSSLLPDVLRGLSLSSPKSITNLLNPTVLPLTVSDSAVALMQTNISQIQDYINFHIGGTGTNPTVIGSNQPETVAAIVNAATVLSSNRQFLQAEAVAHLQIAFPAYVFDQQLLEKFIAEYILALTYDVVYTGNYKSLLAARFYKNSVLGCTTTEDMFYVRNATGIRNCTLTGIESQLNALQGLDQYQKPAGGAYVSLDPGWGPADSRVWINTRSPYIQGVTTIGTGCVGQKVDGALHNGGNRSITSNDFTQVLSDGIGAWITNNGRAEMVSVFTYYAHVGYLAEDGGTIRATNGNCSYGTFGVIADGVDATETPATATINGRSQQAHVAAAFAGDFVDEIQVLEFANAGEDYTAAQAVFTGAGVNASVKFEEFRDDSVSNVQILDANSVGAEHIGGSGYIVVQNNAQTGTTTSITIAANDTNSIAQYLGMRVVITSGEGTGQYGYITAYDNVSKVVSVSRESDNQPGWDHVVPGKPASAQLLSATIYRIEPRVLFSSPAFTTVAAVASDSVAWTEIAYGETTQTFNAVSVTQAGTGAPPVAPITATFDVIKTGRTYSIASNNAGTRYQVGQILTILGTDVGGFTPVHDVTILVTAVSNNTVGSIVSVVQKTYGAGIKNRAASGKFIAVSSSLVAMYSADGIAWTTASMPSSGNWKCLAAGANRFVAIRKGSAAAASSLDGVTWTARTMPASRQWNSCVYGGNVFLAVATDSNSAAYSLNGTSWTTVALPAFGDSTLNEWVDIAYGKNTFVVVANSNNTVAVGTYSSTLNTWSWSGQIMDVISDSSQKDWVSIAYGNGRFVAISSTGDIAYSFQGIEWLPAVMPSQDGSTAHNWKKIRYAQGVFFAVGDTGGRDVGDDATAGPSNFAATSFDGIVWTPRTLTAAANWQSVAFGNPYKATSDASTGRGTPTWVVIDDTDLINTVSTGSTALGRVVIENGRVQAIKLWETGSGYVGIPVVTLVDPNNTADAVAQCILGDGVLSQPSWLNRGLGYRTATTEVAISGDGYAEVNARGVFVIVDDLLTYPGPGADLAIGTLASEFTLVSIEELGATDRGLSARIRVTPAIRTRNLVTHLTAVTIRSQFSQCRITGHDFLDIGTGNFAQTNYPELYSGLVDVQQQNEVVPVNKGRVFFTSTDQDGNFRAGDLFAVAQSTGIVTLSADFFDFTGLDELVLGGVQVGGSTAIIREFSTDPLFVADSNNVVPTQRAIAGFLQNRLSVGGAAIAVGSFIAGTILVGPSQFASSAGLTIQITTGTDFSGASAGIRGSMLAQTLFASSF